MKFIIYFLTFLSIISLIYSACSEGKVNVSGGSTEECGTAITDCKTYDSTSTAAAPLCAVCENSKVPNSGKTACEECASGKETKDRPGGDRPLHEIREIAVARLPEARV